MPRFLERDEAEREPPCDTYPVGRRPQRPAVLAVPGVGDRRGVLNANQEHHFNMKKSTGMNFQFE